MGPALGDPPPGLGGGGGRFGMIEPDECTEDRLGTGEVHFGGDASPNLKAVSKLSNGVLLRAAKSGGDAGYQVA